MWAMAMLSWICYAVHAEDENRIKTILEQLISPKLEARQQALVLVSRERNQLIYGLLKIIHDKGLKPELKYPLEVSASELAVNELGEMRATEAVEVLLASIGFPSSIISQPGDIRFGEYPCVRALVEIGKPASKAALAEIPKSVNNRKRASLLLSVIKSVEGPEVGAFMLKLAMDSAKTEEAKNAYDMALKMFPEIRWE